MFQCSVFKVHRWISLRDSMKHWTSFLIHCFSQSLLRSGGPGLAFLRESHGGCNSPPDCCQEPPFESILALRHPGTQKFSVLASVSLVFEVVGQNGLEPSTSRLSVVCSSQLSYWPISRRNQIHNLRFEIFCFKTRLCLCFSSPN